MSITIHPILDQIAQWFDGELCEKNPKYLTLPLHIRHYSVLLSLDSFELVHRVSETEEAEDWDIPAGWTWALQTECRRTIKCDFECDMPLIRRYVTSMRRAYTNKRNMKCLAAIRGLFDPIQDRCFKIVGWDDRSRLELVVTERGAKVLGMTEGEVFLSAIGLLQTNR